MLLSAVYVAYLLLRATVDCSNPGRHAVNSLLSIGCVTARGSVGAERQSLDERSFAHDDKKFLLSFILETNQFTTNPDRIVTFFNFLQIQPNFAALFHREEMSCQLVAHT